MVPGILEEGEDNADNNSGPAEEMLAQTPHDVVPREAVHNTGGAATSERTGQDQDVQEQRQGVTPTTQNEWVVRGVNNDRLVRIHKTPRRRMFSQQACHDVPPVPLEQIDVQRITLTNLAMRNEGIPILGLLQFIVYGGRDEGAGGNSCARYSHCSKLTADNWAGGNFSKSRNPTIMFPDLLCSKTMKKPLRPS
jgi:hypothetical protein